jgi:hypothetical protein
MDVFQPKLVSPRIGCITRFLCPVNRNIPLFSPMPLVSYKLNLCKKSKDFFLE